MKKRPTPTDEQIIRTRNSATYLRGWTKAKKLHEAQRAIGYVTDLFEDSIRKDGYLSLDHFVSSTSDLAMFNWDAIPSINLDVLFATMLLHDVCEDCGIKPDELPFSEGVQYAVSLLTIVYPEDPDNMTVEAKLEVKKAYFRGLLKDPVAVICKGMDRLYNLTTMEGALKEKAIKKNIVETDQLMLPILVEARELYPEIADILRFLYKFIRIFNCDLAYHYDINVAPAAPEFIGSHRLLGMSTKEQHLEVYMRHYPEAVNAIRYRKEKFDGNASEVDQSIVNNFVSTASDLMMFDWGSIPSINQDILYATMILRDVCKDCGIAPQELPFSEKVKSSVTLLSMKYGYDTVSMDEESRKKAQRQYFQALMEDPIAVVVKGMNRLRRLTTLEGRCSDEEIQAQIIETADMVLPMLSEAKNSYPELGDVLHFLHKFIRLYNGILAMHHNVHIPNEPSLIFGRRVILGTATGESANGAYVKTN